VDFMAWFDRSTGGKKNTEEEPRATTQPEAAAPPTPAPASAAPAPAAEPPAKPVEQKAAPEPEQLIASLHKGSRVSGQLTFQGNAKIEGTVEGEIQCHGKLIIGEGAEIRAKISGKVLVIRGRVEGNISATERIELASPARLYGNINTPRLMIAEGVVFDGDCSMGVAKEKTGVINMPGTNGDKGSAAKAAKGQRDADH
jgi:cytoskeletal protein CcmA (bactofilin family)